MLVFISLSHAVLGQRLHEEILRGDGTSATNPPLLLRKQHRNLSIMFMLACTTNAPTNRLQTVGKNIVFGNQKYEFNLHN